jgi:hypothetical protein
VTVKPGEAATQDLAITSAGGSVQVMVAKPKGADNVVVTLDQSGKHYASPQEIADTSMPSETRSARLSEESSIATFEGVPYGTYSLCLYPYPNHRTSSDEIRQTWEKQQSISCQSIEVQGEEQQKIRMQTPDPAW